jgi:urease accessory protein
MPQPPRAVSILPSGSWPASDEVGVVTLSWDDRHRRRIRLLMDDGDSEFLLDLPQAVRLSDGDGLALEGGEVVRVVAAPEALLEVQAGSTNLAQLAYHIGNRHLAAEITSDHILIRQDHVIEDMLIGLGADCRKVVRPFSPEQGAYGRDSPHAHGHGRAHAGDHTHHDHSHE